MPYKDREKQRQYVNKHYADHKEFYYARSQAQKAKLRKIIQDLKEKDPCVDCGVHYPSFVMQFDHRDAAIKVGCVSALMQTSSKKTVFDEIAKCDLVCANCHAMRTFSREFYSRTRNTTKQTA